jgi:hypothetical protein
MRVGMTSRKRTLLILVLVVASGVVTWSWIDYRSWWALGPGGVPHNLNGWAQVTWLRLWKHDPLDPAVFAGNIGQDWDVRGLGELPLRAGPRPHIDPHPIPHRQKDQFGDAPSLETQRRLFDQEVASNGSLLVYKRSHYELRNDAIWLRDPDKGNPNTRAQGEIGHIHPSDGSMHMTLSPSDAKRVIEAGWGELHPLAEENGRLPATYMMIYAPRDTEEAAIALQVLRAAVKYAAGGAAK